MAATGGGRTVGMERGEWVPSCFGGGASRTWRVGPGEGGREGVGGDPLVPSWRAQGPASCAKPARADDRLCHWGLWSRRHGGETHPVACHRVG